MNAHEERLLAHTRSLRERAVPGSRLAPEIHASWLRCSTAGMTLDLVPDIPVVADADLRRRRDRAGLVRQLALAELETLSQQIAGSNFLLAFGDRDGVILDRRRHPAGQLLGRRPVRHQRPGHGPGRRPAGGGERP